MASSINNTNTGNPEWITPNCIICPARKTMGSIDCDPASSDMAQKQINAKVHYTKATNGITKNWMGNVWLNPPYHSSSNKLGPGINSFAAKLLKEINIGNTKQAIFLAQSKTDTKWFQSLSYAANVKLFTMGRIKFVDSNGIEGGSPDYGSVLFYFGPNKIQFINQFGNFCYAI